MKRLILLFLATCTLQAEAQQSWSWLASPNSQGNMEHLDVDMDPSGNVYSLGKMYQSANFGNFQLNSPYQYFTLYLAKQGNDGAYQFAKRIKSDAGITSAVAKVDASGNAYIFGTCYGYVLHLTDTDSLVYSTTLSTTDQNKFFLAKFDPNGNLVWAKKGEGTQLYANARAMLIKGNDLYIGGEYYGNAAFLGINFSQTTANASFITKVNMNTGDGVWLNAANATAMTYITALAHDGTNIYATGKFQNTIGFNNVNVTNPLFNNHGERIFLFKFDSNGEAVWGREEGGIANYITTAAEGNNANSLAVDGNGNLYLGGSYQDDAGSISNRLQKPFLSKYSTDGTKAWTVTFSSNIENAINGIAVDSNANPIVVGEYIGTMSIGSTALMPDPNARKGFIARLDKTTGSTLSAATIGEMNRKVNVQHIIMAENKAYYVISGQYSASLTLGGHNVTSTGNNTDFTAKYALSTGSSITNRVASIAKLYPNPAQNYINYEVTSRQVLQVAIVNYLGQELLRQNNNTIQGKIDIATLPAGNYQLKIVTNEGISFAPFVKK
jgi:hypothetical protein